MALVIGLRFAFDKLYQNLFGGSWLCAFPCRFSICVCPHRFISILENQLSNLYENKNNNNDDNRTYEIKRPTIKTTRTRTKTRHNRDVHVMDWETWNAWATHTHSTNEYTYGIPFSHFKWIYFLPCTVTSFVYIAFMVIIWSLDSSSQCIWISAFCPFCHRTVDSKYLRITIQR